MHDVLDDRDLIPDEAEQLLHSGYPVQQELQAAREAAAASDFLGLQSIAQKLRTIPRGDDWTFDEPNDDAQLIRLAARAKQSPCDESTLSTRIHGAWLGRCVANTLGKPVEGLTRDEVRVEEFVVVKTCGGRCATSSYVYICGECARS